MKKSKEIDLRIQSMLDVAQRESLSIDQVRAMVPYIFERGLYVSSMEAIELATDGTEPMRMDLSILGLDKAWDEKAARDENYARGVL